MKESILARLAQLEPAEKAAKQRVAELEEAYHDAELNHYAIRAVIGELRSILDQPVITEGIAEPVYTNGMED